MPTVNNYTFSPITYEILENSDIATAVGNSFATITITPNSGFTVTASDFTATGFDTSYISTIVFTQSGANVICTINFQAGITMPSNNLTFSICVTGEGVVSTITIDGTLTATVGSNVTGNASETNTPYSNSGSENEQELLLTRSYNAASGYYFGSTPTANIVIGNQSNYNIVQTPSYDSSSLLTGLQFDINYIYPSQNISGDSIRIIVPDAKQVFSLSALITSWNIPTFAIPENGDSRSLRIFGGQGAIYSVTLSDGTTTTNIASSVTMDSSGLQSYLITFNPNTTGANITWTLQITGDLDSSLTTTITILQTDQIIGEWIPKASSVFLGGYIVENTGDQFLQPPIGSQNSFLNINWTITSANGQPISITQDVGNMAWINQKGVTAEVTSMSGGTANVTDTTGIEAGMKFNLDGSTSVPFDGVVATAAPEVYTRPSAPSLIQSNFTQIDTGWSFSGGTASIDGTQTGTSRIKGGIGSTLVSGRKYKITLNANITGCRVEVAGGGGFVLTTTQENINGNAEFLITATANHTLISILCASTDVGSVSSLSIKDVDIITYTPTTLSQSEAVDITFTNSNGWVFNPEGLTTTPDPSDASSVTIEGDIIVNQFGNADTTFELDLENLLSVLSLPQITVTSGKTAEEACCNSTTQTLYADYGTSSTQNFPDVVNIYTDAAGQNLAQGGLFYASNGLVRFWNGTEFLTTGTFCAPCSTSIQLLYSTTSSNDVCCTTQNVVTRFMASGETFSSTTAGLFQDANLSAAATDGFYKENSSSVTQYREQSSGTLDTAANCPSCGTPTVPNSYEITLCDGTGTVYASYSQGFIASQGAILTPNVVSNPDVVFIKTSATGTVTCGTVQGTSSTTSTHFIDIQFPSPFNSCGACNNAAVLANNDDPT